jgi:hypothetical protein
MVSSCGKTSKETKDSLALGAAPRNSSCFRQETNTRTDKRCIAPASDNRTDSQGVELSQIGIDNSVSSILRLVHS